MESSRRLTIHKTGLALDRSLNYPNREMTPPTKRILVRVGIFTCLMFSAQLFAAEPPIVQVFAPKELSEPLTKIASHDRDEKLILQPEKDLQHWLSITDAGIFIVITAYSKDSFSKIVGKAGRVFIEKGDTVYSIHLAMAALSIPPDPNPSKAVYAYLLSPAAQKIFRSYGYEPMQ